MKLFNAKIQTENQKNQDVGKINYPKTRANSKVDFKHLMSNLVISGKSNDENKNNKNLRNLINRLETKVI